MLNTLDYVTSCLHAMEHNEVSREAMIFSWQIKLLFDPNASVHVVAKTPLNAEAMRT